MASVWWKWDEEPALMPAETMGLRLFCWSEWPHGGQGPAHLTPSLPLCSIGSDQWKMAERKLFNKGIAIYKKDFFLVQKLVSWALFQG